VFNRFLQWHCFHFSGSTFTQAEYRCEVFENSPPTVVCDVLAIDADSGYYGTVQYNITDGNHDNFFTIDPENGYLSTTVSLDREHIPEFNLTVEAEGLENTLHKDKATVIITVLDRNDNAPRFSQIFLTEVSEDTPVGETVIKAFVLQILATDADIGKNSEIFYVIDPQHEEFWVNATTGEIYTKQPLMLRDCNFEIYQFMVTAFDRGSIPLHSNVTIRVRLEQYNHHPPIFFPLQPLMAIPYHLAVGSEVVQFTAVDLDVNGNSSIKYFLNGGNASDFFWIQGDTGKLILNQTLGENENQILTLIAVAEDEGTPPLISQAEITFQITGRNQFTPSFSESYVTFSVPEDLPVGSVIGKIQAEDGDYGPNGAITYNITPENQFLPLSVGEFSGLITLIRELDFEEQTIYHFQIKAKDEGWFSKTGTLNVTVLVMDVNDNPPVFSSSEYITSVRENSAVGTNVLDVTATDIDSGANAQIFYSLIGGHIDKFAVDSGNGTITTLAMFDYEQEQMFDLTIKGSNTGGHALFSLAHVVIQISDVNEFTPRFIKKEFNFSVLKNVPIGTVIGKVTATDGDRGSEGQIDGKKN
uniref:Cadherin domain-containing protein n=1 Tax=Oreochromis niloticus TaxID=8128 RepID=A0A669E8E9_ORENI